MSETQEFCQLYRLSVEGQSSLCKAHLNLAKKVYVSGSLTGALKNAAENKFTQPQQRALSKQVCHEIYAIFMGKCKFCVVSIVLNEKQVNRNLRAEVVGLHCKLT